MSTRDGAWLKGKSRRELIVPVWCSVPEIRRAWLLLPRAEFGKTKPLLLIPRVKVRETHHFLIKITSTPTPSTLFFSLNIVFSLHLGYRIWQEMIFAPEKTAEFTAKRCFPATLNKYLLIPMGRYFLCHFKVAV